MVKHHPYLRQLMKMMQIQMATHLHPRFHLFRGPVHAVTKERRTSPLPTLFAIAIEMLLRSVSEAVTVMLAPTAKCP